MKLLVFVCLSATAFAFPQQGLESARKPAATLEEAGILRMENVINDDNSFKYGFETANGIVQDVTGRLKEIGEASGIIMQGSYSFITKDENGQDVPVTVSWTADENGFQAEGAVIPTASPAIQAAAAAARSVDVTAEQVEQQPAAAAAAAELNEVSVKAPQDEDDDDDEDIEGSGMEEDEVELA